jgi:type I restriction enzyme S subunit
MSKVCLADVAEINPHGPRAGELSPEYICDFVPMVAVSEAGQVIVSDRLPYSDVSKGFTAFQNDDVLVAKITPCYENNKIALASVQSRYAFGSTEFHVIRCSPARLDPKYLTHFLRQDRVRASGEKRMTGSAGQRRVPKMFLEELEIPLPPLDEQKRIAAILDQADEPRRLRQRGIDRLNELGQAIFYEMFGDPVSNPHGYKTEELGSVSDVRDGTHDSPKYVEEGYPLLTSKNFTSGKIVLEGASQISKQDYDSNNKRSKVDVGDIVMPMIGTIGSPVIIEAEPHFAIKNVALIKMDGSHMDCQYIKALLSGNFFRRKVAEQGRGGTQKFISLGDLRRLQIPEPPRDKQKEYSKRVSALRVVEDGYAKHYSEVEILFASLQQLAFQGEL